MAPVGPTLAGTATNFANGAQTADSQAFVAVNSSAPSTRAVTVEAAGQWNPLYIEILEGTVSNNQFSNGRTRFSVYMKNGRFYKVDHTVTSGSLTPQLVSSLTSTSVCASGGIPSEDSDVSGNDFATPSLSWVFIKGPGADGICNNADDKYRAIRLNMAATDAALTIAEPQAEILNADGSFAGMVVLNGTQMQRLDAALGGPVNLFTIVTSGYDNWGASFGSTTTQTWLFVEGGKLWGVNLGSPSTRVALATLNNNERVDDVEADGGTAFVAITDTTTSTTRILRVTEALSTTTIATLPTVSSFSAVTPTRLVFVSATAGLQSIPKAGGTPTTLKAPVTNFTFSQVLAAGENVYAASQSFVGNSYSTLIIGADGSNAQTLANTNIMRGILAASVAFGNVQPYAIVLADGVTPSSAAGGTLRAVEGATRNALSTYGTLATQPTGFLGYGTIDPFQYGQSGLWTFYYQSGNTSTSSLFYYKSDAAGLTPITY